MFTVNHYILAENLEQAYELNQNKANAILGGVLWLKMGGRAINTAIDLSGLGLNKIEETPDSFRIGCMTTLRDIEINTGLQNCFLEFLPSALKHIVGVQFRNGATVGGSIYSRFPFSDVLTVFLALDTEVELYRGGIIPLAQYLNLPSNRDIVVNIIVHKQRRQAAFRSQRLSATDLPILNCAVSNFNGHWKIVLGSRPGRALITEFTSDGKPGKTDIERWIKQIQDTVEFGTNARGSEKYRQHLAGVLMERCITEILAGGSNEN